MDKPKIAIAVYVENGGWGATYGVPYGALMMEQYLNGKLSPASEERAEEMSNRVIMYGDEERQYMEITGLGNDLCLLDSDCIRLVQRLRGKL